MTKYRKHHAVIREKNVALREAYEVLMLVGQHFRIEGKYTIAAYGKLTSVLPRIKKAMK